MTPTDGPTPGRLALELQVECRVSRKATRGRPHELAIEPDWTVRVPHDLEAERVAAAFGGYTSCLELVDVVVPAVRRALPLLRRQEIPRLTRLVDARVRWRADPVRDCRCANGVFDSAQDAAAHLRSPGHLAKQYGVAARPLTTMIEAVEAAWGGFAAPPPSAAARAKQLVREFRGVESLWAAGLHPDHVASYAALASQVDEPLPESYYLGLAYGDVDRTWLASTLVRRPDPDGAAWLAWISSSLDSEHLTALQEWFALGLDRRQIEALTAQEVTIAEAEALASARGRPLRTSSGDLATWALAGCRPTVEHMQALDRHGLASCYSPSRAAVDRLVEIAGHYALPPSRTELGVMLALEGTQHNVVVQLQRGVRSVADLLRVGQQGVKERS